MHKKFPIVQKMNFDVGSIFSQFFLFIDKLVKGLRRFLPFYLVETLFSWHNQLH